MMRQVDDNNYESMISRLAKGSIEQKSQSLKKLLFLYENARSRIYLYERRITESLELSLLIEEKDISLNALNLLERIVINTSTDSDIINIIKKRLLSKVVLNLGSIEIAIRKVSHKCLLEYVRKFKDYEAITTVYIKTAIHQSENLHLKLKAINSYHSLLMGESKYYSHEAESSKLLLEELVHASYQKEYNEIRRAALLCLIFILKIRGSEMALREITAISQNEIYQLKLENQELAALLDSLLKHEEDSVTSQAENNAPSPKFISIQETEQLKTIKNLDQLDQIERIPDHTQIKIFNEVSYAEQFLKKLEKSGAWQFEQIQEFAPFLEKCLIDESIKLFSISKKIVEVIFNCDGGKKKQYYVVLVPCIVNGIGNKRFIVRKNLDKLVRQYVKNHTEVWIKNFLERFAATKNIKVKEILIELLMHAYRTSPEFYSPTQKTFEIFDAEINDSNSHLKRKVIDCVVLILEKQGKDEKSRDEMLQIFSADPYQKIIRKMGKTNNSIESYSEEADTPLMEPISPINFRKERKNRLITAEPEKMTSIDKSSEKDKSCQNVSEGKYKNNRMMIQPKEKKVRNSQIEITFKLKKNERRSKEEKASLERLPELKKVKNSSNSKHDINESPVKRSIGEKNIIYTERQHLKTLDSPKSELEKALAEIKDPNWNIQFEAINKIRSIVEFHKELINDEYIAEIVNELLNSLNNLRSGVTKLALMCLGEMMRKFHKKMYHFTENIVLTIMKKSITTSEFMQDEIKKTIVTAAEELCVSKIIIALNSMRDSKSTEIKVTFLLFVEVFIKNEKVFRKEFEWIWTILLDFHEEPQFTLRSQCKKLVKFILENYKNWKADVLQLKKQYLDKIDKILKNLNTKGENLWIEIQNQEFEKAILSKVMTAKYFSASFNKFEELDKSFTLKKSWKERIKLLNDVFQSAFDHPSEFESNSNAKKYMLIACDQIDEKNPGLLLNSLNNLIKSVDAFPNLLEECLGIILERCLLVIETRRVELVTMGSKMMGKIYAKYDLNKVMKEYLKMLGNHGKTNKAEVINQITVLLRQNEQKEGEHRSIREISLDCNSLSNETQSILSQNHQNLLIKSLAKLCSDKPMETNMGVKMKELLGVCQRRLGQEFGNKVMSSDKLAELLL